MYEHKFYVVRRTIDKDGDREVRILQFSDLSEAVQRKDRIEQYDKKHYSYEKYSQYETWFETENSSWIYEIQDEDGVGIQFIEN